MGGQRRWKQFRHLFPASPGGWWNNWKLGKMWKNSVLGWGFVGLRIGWENEQEGEGLLK